MTLAVGARVFYPGYGVVSVAGTVEREFGGERQQYYVLELDTDASVKLMLPMAKLPHAALRNLISAGKARALMNAVGQSSPPEEARSDPGSRRRRAAGYREALLSGAADEYTAALRQLMARFRCGKLSPGEKQTFQQVLAMFVGEISAALQQSPDDVRAELRSIADLPAAGW